MDSNIKSNMDIKRRAYLFALEILGYCRNIKNNDIGAQILIKQLIRAATSVGANIIEGQAAPSKRDFTNFINISLKSANETKFWLGLMRDSHLADRDNTNLLLKEIEELSKILGASIITLRNK